MATEHETSLDVDALADTQIGNAFYHLLRSIVRENIRKDLVLSSTGDVSYDAQLGGVRMGSYSVEQIANCGLSPNGASLTLQLNASGQIVIASQST